MLEVWDDYMFIGLGTSIGPGGSAAPNVYDFDGSNFNAGTQLDDHSLYEMVYASYKMWLLGQDDDDDTTGNIYPYAGNRTWTLTSPATLVNQLHVLGGVEFEGDFWLGFGASTNGPIVGRSTDRGLTFTIYNVPDEAITTRPLRAWTLFVHEGELYVSTSGSIWASAPSGYTSEFPWLMTFKYDSNNDEWVSSGFNFAPDDPIDGEVINELPAYGRIAKVRQFAGETVYITGRTITDFELTPFSMYRLTGTTPIKLDFMGDDFKIRDFVVFNDALWALGNDSTGKARLWVTTDLDNWVLLGQWEMGENLFARVLCFYKGVLYYGDSTVHNGTGEAGNIYALEAGSISAYSDDYDYQIGIATQPASQNVANGGTASLSVVASGDGPFTYQWYSGTSGDTSSPVSGAITENYTTGVLTAGASYWVRITGKGGRVDSNTAILIVAPEISGSPTLIGDVGQAYSYSGFTATGSTPTWSIAVKDPTGASISGHGLSINSGSAAITGTLGDVTGTYTGKWTVEVTATNAAGSDTYTYTLYVYKMRDLFTTNASAPLSNPRTAEPGGQSITLVQTDGEFSISSSRLNFPAQGTPALGDQGFYHGTYSLVPGRVLMGTFRYTTSSIVYPFAWSTANNLSLTTGSVIAFYLSSTNFRLRLGGGVFSHNALTSINSSTDYELAVMMRNAGGAAVFIKGGAYTAWTCWLVLNNLTITPAYGLFTNFAAVGTLDNLRIMDAPPPFNDDYGYAVLNQANPVSGTDYLTSAHADDNAPGKGTFAIRFTTPSAFAGTSLGMRYRKTASDTYIEAFINTSGQVGLRQLNGGTPTGLITAGGSMAVNTSYVVFVTVIDNVHSLYLQLAANGATSYIGQATNSQNPTATTMEANQSGGYTLSALRAFPMLSDQYDILDTF
jgi:hypothetical protein